MQECLNKDKTITIGLRQTLKAYNSKKLKWIFLDSSTVSPSAVGQVMGLMATNGTKETKFYVIPDLSTTISKSLNLPKVSAIGFGADCVEHLKEVIETLHPIDIGLKKKAETVEQPSTSSSMIETLHPIDIGLKKKAETVEQPSTSSSSPFILPQLEVPKGKTKLSKKQKKKMNAGKKK
uniref:Uncharacterized protein n=1 Tax=Panagrolaimus sp. PS1159 TaxID=55785 RepID=A0AC35G6X6_9BILA